MAAASVWKATEAGRAWRRNLFAGAMIAKVAVRNDLKKAREVKEERVLSWSCENSDATREHCRFVIRERGGRLNEGRTRADHVWFRRTIQRDLLRTVLRCARLVLYDEIFDMIARIIDLDLIHHARVEECLRTHAGRDERVRINGEHDVVIVVGSGENEDVGEVCARSCQNGRRVGVVGNHAGSQTVG